MISKKFSFYGLVLIAVLGFVSVSNAQTMGLGQSQLYVRGDLSYGSYAERSHQPVAYRITEDGYDGASIISAGMIDVDSSSDVGVTVGVGMDFDSRWRADLTYEYRTAREYDSTLTMYDKLAFNGGHTNTELMFSGDMTSQLFMFNVYYDARKRGVAGKNQIFVPYVGAGIGVAYHDISSLVQRDPNAYDSDVQTTVNSSGTEYTVGKDNTAGGTAATIDLGLGTTDMSGGNTSVQGEITERTTAYMLTAGLGVKLTSSTVLDLSYRYLDMGDVELAVLPYRANMSPAAYNSVREIGYHQLDMVVSEVKVGLRIDF